MAVILYAPWGAFTTGIALPDPRFNDTVSLKLKSNIKRSLNGRRYSYVKSSDKQTLVYDFDLTTLVSYSLKGFIQSYNAAELLMVNHLNEQWRVVLKNNPFEFISDNYRKQCFESVSVRLEFEGTKL